MAALAHDDPLKEENQNLSANISSNGGSSRKTTKSEFDSLEVLFDFPSSAISSDTHLEIDQSTSNSNHIRFSETNEIITTDKVFDFFL
jgi:hypothetical protein